MRRFLLALVAAGFISFTEKAAAQNVVMNNGGLIHVQAGALFHVQGGIVNKDNGANNGVIDNYGTITLQNTTNPGSSFDQLGTLSADFHGDVHNRLGAELILRDNSTLNVADDFTNDATVNAESSSLVNFNGDGTYGTQDFKLATGTTFTTGGFGNVTVNNTAAAPLNRVNLVDSTATSDLVIMNTLNFVDGVIFTAATNRTDVMNALPNAIIGHSGAGMPGYGGGPQTERFVMGNGINGGRLRRWIDVPSTPGDIDFPVGSVNKGYQLLRLRDITVFPVDPTIEMRFIDAQSAAPNDLECSAFLNQTLDNGQWVVFDGYPTGNVRTIVYPVATNGGGAVDRTIIRDALVLTGNGQPMGNLPGPDPTSCAVLNGPGTNTNTMVPRAAMANFGNGNYAVAFSTVHPFPVENLALRATSGSQSIFLYWQTDREVNNLGFEVERSTDAVSFQKIGWVAGNGNTNTTSHYRMEDVNVVPNQVYYYRLRQLDVNGQFKYSNIVEGKIVAVNAFAAALYPNPTNGELSLQFTIANSGKVNFKLYDAVGKLLVDRNFEVSAGQHTESLSNSIQQLAAGSYQAVITGEAGTVTQKLVITR
jgi:hypothetical protein